MLIEEHETLHNKIHTTYNNKNYWLPIVNRKKSRIFHCETTPLKRKGTKYKIAYTYVSESFSYIKLCNSELFVKQFYNILDSKVECHIR